MDGVKDFFEVFESKLRSPVLGSTLLSFIAINWKALYVVIFSSTSFAGKFEYFDNNTDPLTLLVYPLLLGLFVVLLGPWLKLIGAHLSKLPTSKLKTLQAITAHETLLYRQKLASERKRLLATEEEALIEQAKRDQIIQNEISDTKIREDLERQIKDLRKAFEVSNSKITSEQLEEIDAKLAALEGMSAVNSAVISDIQITQEKRDQIEVIQDRIKRYRAQLKSESLAEFQKVEIEEKIIEELSNIDAIKKGLPYPGKNLDDEIPF